jgi:hypothetical protein
MVAGFLIVPPKVEHVDKIERPMDHYISMPLDITAPLS